MKAYSSIKRELEILDVNTDSLLRKYEFTGNFSGQKELNCPRC